ncbi:hypothetical protein [Sphingobium xenophagum]|uniref:hypothetical protein n=1 Tax=Sphingobium xenophagum TaxID=121428 RepID=UPI001FD414D4|nr:hypothetical protein [Sphingobium xenophagum]
MGPFQIQPPAGACGECADGAIARHQLAPAAIGALGRDAEGGLFGRGACRVMEEEGFGFPVAIHVDEADAGPGRCAAGVGRLVIDDRKTARCIKLRGFGLADGGGRLCLGRGRCRERQCQQGTGSTISHMRTPMVSLSESFRYGLIP